MEISRDEKMSCSCNKCRQAFMEEALHLEESPQVNMKDSSYDRIFQ